MLVEFMRKLGLDLSSVCLTLRLIAKARAFALSPPAVCFLSMLLAAELWEASVTLATASCEPHSLNGRAQTLEDPHKVQK
jgi:hypothetical protein